MRDFSEVERLFEQFFAQSGALMTLPERGEVQHFVDHGEYGLALETLVTILTEKGQAPPEEAFAAITALANSMSMDLQS